MAHEALLVQGTLRYSKEALTAPAGCEGQISGYMWVTGLKFAALFLVIARDAVCII